MSARFRLASTALLLVVLALTAALGGFATVADAGISRGGVTEMFVQNLMADRAVTTVVEAHPLGGGLSHVFILGPLGPLQAIPVDADDALEPGVYSAVAVPNGDIGVTWWSRWPTSGGAVAATDQISATDVLVPYVARNADAETSLISIVSTNFESPQSVGVTVRSNDDPGRSVQVNYALRPGGSVTLDLGQDAEFAPLGDAFIGSAAISGEFPVVVDALVDVQDSPNGVMSFEGSGSEAAWSHGIAPIVGHQGALLPGETDSPVVSSSVAIMNPASEAAQVQIRYRGVVGGSGCAGEAFGAPTVSVPAGSAVLVEQADPNSGLPTGCLATATISSDTGVVAIALLRSENGLAAAYNLIPSSLASEHVLFPRFHKDAEGVTSVTAIVNVSQAPSDVSVRLGDDSGDPPEACASCSLSIPPGDTRFFWPSSAGDVADGSSGELVLESTGRTVAVTLDVPADSTWDMTAVQGQSPTGEHRSHWLPAWWNLARRPTPDAATPTGTATDTPPSDTPTTTPSDGTPDASPSATSGGPGPVRIFLPRVLNSLVRD